MTEKQLFKRLMKRIGMVLIVFVLFTIILDLTCGKRYNCTYDESHYAGINPSAENIAVHVENPEVLEVSNLQVQDGAITLAIKGLRKGQTTIELTRQDTGETILYEDYKVTWNHSVVEVSTGNYSNWKLQRILILLLMVECTVLLWESFATARKRAGYSYHAIFCCGFGIWNTVADLVLLVSIFRCDSMISVYGAVQAAGNQFMLFSIPFILAFAVALSVSNISLIRHEGICTRNILGIGISAAMILGEAINETPLFSDFSGTELGWRIYEALHGAYCAVYCLLECFLLGAVICGTLAAMHEPEYDKDFIIILGCRVRQDGTLYPLIRGRVDRAISFYQAQLEKTGKKAVFVPSGGQGADETISEADAMKRYLLEHGFQEDDILVENQSKNTMENMKFSRKLIEERMPQAKAAFSTTNYHVFRSGIIARQQGFEAEGMGGKTKWYFWPNAYVREMIGMMVYCRKNMILLLILLVAFFGAIAFVY